MGMLDEYEPRHQLFCAACARPLEGWQGKEGPSVLVRWLEGHRWPIETVDEQGRDEEFMRRFLLPDEFEIYTFCDRGHAVVAKCRCRDGVWQETVVDRSRSEAETTRLKSIRPVR